MAQGQGSVLRMLGWIALGLVVFEGIRHWPDMVRYIKIERM